MAGRALIRMEPARRAARRCTPNALALSRAFADDALDAGVAGPRSVADPAEASLVLVAYTCLFVLVGLALFRRRPLD